MALVVAQPRLKRRRSRLFRFATAKRIAPDREQKKQPPIPHIKMWCRGLLSLSAPLSLRLGFAAIVGGGREIEHPLVIFLFSNSTVSQLDPAKLPLQKELLKQMIMKLYSRVRLLLERIIGNGYCGAISEYNARQKRNDRKITVSYYEHQFGRGYSPNVVTSADKRKSFYEDVVQIGDMKDTGVGTVDAETAKAVLTEYTNL